MELNYLARLTERLNALTASLKGLNAVLRTDSTKRAAVPGLLIPIERELNQIRLQLRHDYNRAEVVRKWKK